MGIAEISPSHARSHPQLDGIGCTYVKAAEARWHPGRTDLSSASGSRPSSLLHRPTSLLHRLTRSIVDERTSRSPKNSTSGCSYMDIPAFLSPDLLKRPLALRVGS